MKSYIKRLRGGNEEHEGPKHSGYDSESNSSLRGIFILILVLYLHCRVSESTSS